MFRHAIAAALLVLAAAFAVCGAETITIDPAKAAQLKRLEPLSAAKIDVFVEAGQLSAAQAAFVKQHLGADGKLNLPPEAIAAEPPSQPAAAPAAPAGSGLSGADSQLLIDLVKKFRSGDKPEIGRELRKFRPGVNAIIASAYNDPIDLPTKIKLWEEVAGPANPDAATYLFETHRAAYELAKPVLIPYAKDIGGAVVRRKKTTDNNPYPSQRVFTSRELRDMIIDIEGLIAHCSSPGAAIFLMGVYSERYGEGDAPMRDDGRDWRRMVEACGGSPKHFDADDSKTWDSRLGPADRAAIAERLLPWLSRSSGDRRKIARNGLKVCLGGLSHPDWDAGRAEWEHWWEGHKGDIR